MGLKMTYLRLQRHLPGANDLMYMANIMSDDDLATPGARASSVMMLAYFGNIYSFDP